MCKVFYKKINSSVGASLAIALLLFLACTVVGTVVLTAASAVSGRAAELTFMDQRYHSVASAAALLEKELCGKDVTIVRKKTLVTTESISYEHSSDDDGSDKYTRQPMPPTYRAIYETNIGIGEGQNKVKGGDEERRIGNVSLPRDEDPPSTEKPVSIAGSQDTDISYRSFLTTMAEYLLFGAELRCNTDAAMDYSFSESPYIENNQSKTFWIVHSSNSDDNPNNPAVLTGENLDVLRTACDYVLKKDGTLVIKIRDDAEHEPSEPLAGGIPENPESSETVDTSLNHYVLTLYLTPVYTETETNTTEESPPEIEFTGSDYTETREITTTQTKILTVSWIVGSIG